MDKLLHRNDFAAVSDWSQSDENWLNSRFPFLSAACLRVAMALESDWGLALQSDSLAKPEQNRQSVDGQKSGFIKAATSQLEELSHLARSNDPQSRQARRILWLILLFPGKQPELLAEACTNFAARTVSQIAHWPTEQISENQSCACTALTRRVQLSAQVRLHVLDAFMHLAVRDTTIENRLSAEKIGAVLTEAFLLELSRLEHNQNLAYSEDLLRKLKIYRYPAAAEVLSVVAESHWSPTLRQLAQETLEALNDTLQRKWDATICNEALTAQARADQLASQVKERDTNQLIKSLFLAFKKCPVKDDNDPRLSSLNKLFAHPSDLIRVASCYALINSIEPDCPSEIIAAAIGVLTDLAINSRSAEVMADALALFEWLRLAHTSAREQIEIACANANAKFIKLQMRSFQGVSLNTGV